MRTVGVLADRVWPGASVLRDAVLLGCGVLVVAIGAHLEIPLRPVPITGQTFGVLLCGALLGWRRGGVAMVLYLAMGAIGVPVFAPGGALGIARFLGPTAGYLVAFPIAAAATGALCERGWDRRVLTTAAAMGLGSLIILSLGTIWLSRFVGWSAAFAQGFLPFLVGDALKLGLASVVLPACWGLAGRSSGRRELSE
jgi:biotin transport system substrate-specific component